jgi:beta-lactamase regulating signal transducer with metallopeptidase domain
VAFGLALPAFIEFEPYSTTEGMGLRLTTLAVMGALAALGMAARGIGILRATRKAHREWRERAQRIDITGLRAPVYRVDNAASLLAVTGIFRPRIFVAGDIIEALSADELKAALTHEMAHVSSFDNLKQLLLKITRAPRWLKPLYNVDPAWASAAEIAADRGALAEGASVIDLSSALIKVGRLKRPAAGGQLIASHMVPSACSGSLERRIACLSEILAGTEAAPVRGMKLRMVVPLMIILALYLACIPAILPAVHDALEFLVR